MSYCPQYTLGRMPSSASSNNVGLLCTTGTFQLAHSAVASQVSLASRFYLYAEVPRCTSLCIGLVQCLVLPCCGCVSPVRTQPCSHGTPSVSNEVLLYPLSCTAVQNIFRESLGVAPLLAMLGVCTSVR